MLGSALISEVKILPLIRILEACKASAYIGISKEINNKRVQKIALNFFNKISSPISDR